MKVVYIAGKYREYRTDGNYDIDAMLERTLDMRRVAKKYMAQGYCVISPLLNFFLFDSQKFADDFWFAVDEELIRRCDAIVMMEGWDKSQGAIHELKFAESLGLEVIYDK
jgi:hypothetical protein